MSKGHHSFSTKGRQGPSVCSMYCCTECSSVLSSLWSQCHLYGINATLGEACQSVEALWPQARLFRSCLALWLSKISFSRFVMFSFIPLWWPQLKINESLIFEARHSDMAARTSNRWSKIASGFHSSVSLSILLSTFQFFCFPLSDKNKSCIIETGFEYLMPPMPSRILEVSLSDCRLRASSMYDDAITARHSAECASLNLTSSTITLPNLASMPTWRLNYYENHLSCDPRTYSNNASTTPRQ